MCISAWPAVFSKTITGTWEVLVDDKVQHVIWYQNCIGGDDELPADASHKFEEYVVQLATTGRQSTDLAYTLRNYGIDPSLAAEEADRRNRGDVPRRLYTALGAENIGNCLIIPILGSWESIRLLNTMDVPNFLSDIDTALKAVPISDNTLRSSARGSWGGDGGRMVFLQFDVYDIVIAEHASDIAGVIGQIDPTKRPTVNSEVFKVMEDWYQSPVAVCCFASVERAEAKPIAFAFEPTDPEHLVVYTLDGHDGDAPKPDAYVTVEHTIFVGSYQTPAEYSLPIPYSDQIPDHLRPYVLGSAMGMQVHGEMLNGDFVFKTEAVRRGVFSGERRLPRYAPRRRLSEFALVREAPYSNGHRSRQVF